MAFTGARVYVSAGGYNVDDTTNTAIEWTHAEYEYGGDFWVLAVNPERITIPSGGDGYYAVRASIGWNADADGFRRLRIYRNTATLIAETTRDAEAGVMNSLVSATVYMEEDDYFWVQVYHSAGNVLGLEPNGYNTYFCCDLMPEV